MLTVRDGKSEQHQAGDPEHDQWHERNQAVGKQRYENAGAIIAQGLRSAQANFGSLCAACRYLRGEAIDDAKRQEVRAIPSKRQRNGEDPDGIQAEETAVQITVPANGSTVHEKFVGGREADLHRGSVELSRSHRLEVTADPDAWLGEAEFPTGIRLPAGFIEIGRRPGGIVTGSPDALLQRNGNDAGIFRLGAKDRRSEERKQ
jgi:hypothetical protein